MDKTRWQKAKEFIIDFYQETGQPGEEAKAKLEQIQCEIKESDTYMHTFEELEYGARLAWRNSNSCIGRLF